MKRKKVNAVVKRTVSEILLDNPDCTASDLKRDAEKTLKRRGYNYRYTERTYLNIKNRLSPLGPKPLDKPWTIGSCKNYDIPLDVVIPMQRQLLQYGRFLTIRRARWYSKLHPVLSPLLEIEHPGEPERNQFLLFQIASFYNRMEQVSEINGEDYADTRNLDNTFIIKQDFSPETFSAIFEDLFYEMPSKSEEKPSTMTTEEILAGEMADEERKSLARFIKFEISGEREKALNLYKSNPNIQPFIEKWRALSLRRDINKQKGVNK